jgi:hypothetical protein
VSRTSQFVGEDSDRRAPRVSGSSGIAQMTPKRGGRLRLVRSLRDEGTLLWGTLGTRPVTYAIDVYSQGDQQSGTGDVRGDLSILVGRSPSNVRLRLADGAVVAVTLTDIETDGASIELVGPVPSPTASTQTSGPA